MSNHKVRWFVFLFLVLSTFVVFNCGKAGKETPPAGETPPGGTEPIPPPTPGEAPPEISQPEVEGIDLGDKTRPTVISTSPENGATVVDIYSSVKAAFSEEMARETVNKDTFTVSDEGGAKIEGQVEYDEATKTATFRMPQGKFYYFSKKYTAMISSGVADRAGNTIASDYVWSFTSQPMIFSTMPEDNSKGWPVYPQNIIAVFTKFLDPSAMDIVLTLSEVGADGSSKTLVDGEQGLYEDGGKTLVAFTPKGNLNYSKNHVATVFAALKANGAKVGEYSWGFKTRPGVILTGPSNGAKDVPGNSKIIVVFSEPMDSKTINRDTFTLNGLSAGVYTYYPDTNTDVADPSTLSYETPYAAKISKDVKSTDETTIGDDYTWSFTTGKEPDTTPPTLLSVTPQNNAVHIMPDTQIKAEFSEAINPSTINLNTFKVAAEGTSSGVVGVFDFPSDGKTVTFIPNKNLKSHIQYTVTIKGDVKDLAGNPLAGGDQVKTFTTGIWPAVAGGLIHSLALAIDGKVYAWGENGWGQLGDGTNAKKSTPVQVCKTYVSPNCTEYLTNVVAIAAGMTNSLALRSDGTLWAWGDNGYGQLGDGTNAKKSTPVQVCKTYDGQNCTEYLSNVIVISAGAHHSMAVVDDGTSKTLWTWGWNAYGQLGDGTVVDKKTPIQISLTDVVLIAGGLMHSVAARGDRTVWAWGYNCCGQLGNDKHWSEYPQGGPYNELTPVQVCANSGCSGYFTDPIGILSIGAGGHFTAALKYDVRNQTVWTWGWNSNGRLGDGTIGPENSKIIPVQVCRTYSEPGCTAFLGGVTALSIGGAHAIAVESDKTVVAWGYNNKGRLGNGTTTDSPIAIDVTGLTDITYVAGGGEHSLAVKSDGTIWSWGGNYYGQLGNGKSAGNYEKDKEYELTPVQVIGLDLID